VLLGSDEGKVYGSLITSAKRTGPESESHTERRKRKGMCIFWCILEGNSFISIVYQTHSQTKECRIGNWTTVILGTCIRQGIISTGMLEPVWLVWPGRTTFWSSFNGILYSRPAIHILTAGNNLLPEPFLVTEDNVVFCCCCFFLHILRGFSAVLHPRTYWPMTAPPAI